MSETHIITRSPEVMPATPQALAMLDHELDEVTEGGLITLAEAWMLEALPHRRAQLMAAAESGRLVVGDGWVHLDPYALAGPRPANRDLAAEVVALFPGAELRRIEQVVEPRVHATRAGLCLEQRALADRVLTRALGSRALHPALLPALTGAGLGGAGDASTEALALEALRSAGGAVDVTADPSISLGDNKLPKRCRSLKLDGPSLAVEWSRALGLRWSQCPDCDQLLSLEVQSDAGGRGAFVAGSPPRPRVFEGRHGVPVHFGADGASLSLVRDLRLPVEPGEPRGRRAYSSLELTLRIEGGRLDVLVRLLDPVAGQRYRLWFPVPFHPRPTSVATVGADGACRVEDREGPFESLPVMPPVVLCGERHQLQLGGAGLREVEVFARKNSWVCAVTLLRAPVGEAPPRSVTRAISAAWREMPASSAVREG